MADAPSDPDILRPDAPGFRSVLGHFATGVTIVTAMDDGEPVGMAANSFSSVSLDPPLVLFCAALTSSTWPRIQRSRGFAVNILGEHQEHVSQSFATRGADRFGSVGWNVGVGGSPILDDVVGFLDCRIEAEHEAGDHVIVVGRVLDLGLTKPVGPLLFHRGAYGRLLG
ncbi:MAG TPA: flavin reductase family protein [Acidimicrobiia bacterium]|nr:flavin reductase family protein [Acidimicrobiia bacterium]